MVHVVAIVIVDVVNEIFVPFVGDAIDQFVLLLVDVHDDILHGLPVVDFDVEIVLAAIQIDQVIVTGMIER